MSNFNRQKRQILTQFIMEFLGEVPPAGLLYSNEPSAQIPQLLLGLLDLHFRLLLFRDVMNRSNQADRLSNLVKVNFGFTVNESDVLAGPNDTEINLVRLLLEKCLVEYCLDLFPIIGVKTIQEALIANFSPLSEAKDAIVLI